MNRSIDKKSRTLGRSASNRRGAIVVLVAVMLVVVFGLVALATDVGYITVAQNELQTSADAAACAAIRVLGSGESEDQALAIQAGVELAEMNSSELGEVLKTSDVTFGKWDSDNRIFTPGNSSPNAIKVVLHRSDDNDNPVSLFFAGVLGHNSADLTATAIATVPSSDGPQFRFLVDDEMFDTDEPSIEDLADSLGVTPDDLLADADGDGFIDIPGGSTLELPTGQVGDEGLFDRATYESAFPFRENSDYTMLDFLAQDTALQQLLNTQELQDVEWVDSNAPHPDLVGSKLLDPVPGTEPMSSHADILSLPDPDVIHVSPLFSSDVAMAETDPSKYGAPASNLQGARRGLVAFKIISARNNPNGGSYLPLVTVEIIDPSTINLDDVTLEVSSNGGGSTSTTLVQ